MKKTFYYQFNKIDGCVIVLLLELAFILCLGISHPWLWGAVLFTIVAWGYKNVIKHPAVVITDKDVKVDYSKPIEWKDIQLAKIRTVRLCGKDKKVLSLIPKDGIEYKYSYLQKNNCDFGPFPIPLYGVLSPADEQEIIQLVKEHVTIE